ncbi:ribose-phosphate pyrophosphokinase [Geosmithia morbida]|uniref:Ribose-phosphate pyrophosphokinase n=1 Tax=Geosmithia morbida TaxID=1094350 RepID=A0A9P5D4A8_9HYPO|nr:ribose-phosphate pyrophosphokinase [Geosmithia morbida]KAF4125852.1 ribose-phosphate pyrophosphokinase [Geosmithia morbida]
MVRNLVLLGGNSHPQLTDSIGNILGIPTCSRILTKFSGGESRCEIKDSVRGKDVYIVQSGSGSVNDNLMELCIMISACKTGSAKRVTAVVPLFPYSRQPDFPYNKSGAPLSRNHDSSSRKDYTFESVPATPRPGRGNNNPGILNGVNGLAEKLSKAAIAENASEEASGSNGDSNNRRSDTISSIGSTTSRYNNEPSFTTHDYEKPAHAAAFQAKPGYKQWVALAGTLVADLLTCAGADHIITMDLHDPQYQGFFDIPVDNLYGKPLIQNYIRQNIPDFRDAVVVSPDAGGAKRASLIRDSLNIDFALIHKERRPIKFTEQRNASMMLVGDVANRVCILVDDLVDTGNTITRAAKLLKREGATKVYALVTHGVFSSDSISRLNASAIDKIIVTNSVPQDEHRRMCPKLEVLDISPVFAEAIRRVHHGESISVLFQYT